MTTTTLESRIRYRTPSLKFKIQNNGRLKPSPHDAAERRRGRPISG